MNRIIPKEVVQACATYRQSIWWQPEIEGLYTVLNLEGAVIDGEHDSVVLLKKDDYYLVMLASDFLKAVIASDMDKFDKRYCVRIIDMCNGEEDYLLPKSFEVIGTHEVAMRDEDGFERILIIKDN